MQSHDPAASGAEPFERRLATILMADIVGYSRLMEANEERTLRVFRGHREIFDALLKQHRGRIFNTAGDAVLAEFPSAVEAVRCATEIQSALSTRNDHLAADERMQFRIGVNLGDVIVQGTDLLGDGVNVAARIQTAAEPGGVCVSGSVYDQIRNKLSLEFHPMGERTFKNISQPVRVFSIGEGLEPGVQRTAPTAVAAAGGSRPVAAIALGAIAVVLVLGGGWWFVQDREQKAAEAARAAEQSRAAEAAKRKAEDDAAVKAAAEREGRLKAELEAAQREAADAKKRAETARVATAAPAAKAAAAPPAATSTPQASASPAPAAKEVYRHDGLYRGRGCWELPGSAKGPSCWNFDLAVEQNRIDSSWIGSYGGGKPSTMRGQLTASGQVNALFEGFNLRGQPVRGDIGGQVADGRMTLSGTLANRAQITATATRVR
ncbi:MAG: adenylate/guanylate cyclase domain-containing protein [Burkholderiales bacterium]